MDLRRGTSALYIAALLLAPVICSAQSTRPEDLGPGKIIITPRDSPDPHFANSVIVLAHYDRTGALGLMLHYRSDLTLRQALPGFEEAGKRTDPIFVGGPVEIPAILALIRSKTVPRGSSHVAGNLYLLTSGLSLRTELTEGRLATDLRVFIGYSGWGPGQLEREVQRHGWYIFDYDESIVFDEHPDTLWDRMIGRTERRLAILRR